LARTQANWLASNQPLSQYGNKSTYCWAPDRAEPGLLWVPEPGYSYLDSSRPTKTGRQLSRYRISEYSKVWTPKRYLTDAIGIYDVMETGQSELAGSRIMWARGTPRDTKINEDILDSTHRALAHQLLSRSQQDNPNHCHRRHLAHLSHLSEEIRQQL